jgi:hypothetical protein
MTGVCRFEVTPIGRACSRSSFAEGHFIFHLIEEISFCEQRDATKAKSMVAAQCDAITLM